MTRPEFNQQPIKLKPMLPFRPNFIAYKYIVTMTLVMIACSFESSIHPPQGFILHAYLQVWNGGMKANVENPRGSVEILSAKKSPKDIVSIRGTS